MWIVEPSSRGKFMIIEENDSQDGRLVADKLSKDDAERIVKAVNETSMED